MAAADRAALVREFVKQELGERHPYQWAIHRPKAADGQDQPHAHLMFSERRLDGIARDPSQFFRRYNAKAPEKGGAHKRFGEVDGPNRSQAQRNADLRALRGRWGEMVNDHLARAGLNERIDMRSLKDQGKDRAPEKKQLPSAWRDPNQRAVILEYRQINREQDQAAAEFRAVVPEGHVMDLEAQRAKRRDARQQEKREQIAAIMAGIEQPKAPAPIRDQAKTPTAPAVAPTTKEAAAGRPRNVGKQDPEAVYALRLKPLQEAQQKAAAASLEALQTERQQWTQAHRDHQKREPRVWGRAKWEAAGAALDATGRDLDRREGAAVKAADPQAIERAAVAELRRQAPAVVAAAEAARKEREAREQEARRLEQEKRRAEYEKAQIGKDFNSMAVGREGRMFGYTDRSEKWQAFPDELKQKIEDYNRLPKEQRAKELERIGQDPQTAKLVREARESSRAQGRSR